MIGPGGIVNVGPGWGGVIAWFTATLAIALLLVLVRWIGGGRATVGRGVRHATTPRQAPTVGSTGGAVRIAACAHTPAQRTED